MEALPAAKPFTRVDPPWHEGDDPFVDRVKKAPPGDGCFVADENLDSATMVIAQELAHGPSIAHAATKRLVSVAVNEGLAAADNAMAEIQRPIFGSADFRTGVRSYRENGIGTAEFEGR